MWWLLLVPIFLLVLVVVMVLVLPVEVEIDTEKELYEARGWGILGFRILPGREKWQLFYRIFSSEKEWQSQPAKPVPHRRLSKVKKSKPPFSVAQMWRLGKNMIRAIRVKRLWVNWDTDDFSLNARLYPLFQFLSGGRRRFNINFNGKQELAIHLQTRLYRVAWAFLKVFFHPKIHQS